MEFDRLLNWYEINQRDLIFRKTKNPYHIWVSEIMLQQTQVDTVLPYFEKFIKTYPNIKELAATQEEVLLKNVEGLGYYRRFKNMHKAAIMIQEHHHGIFPTQYEDIIKLPGIGKYTAGAILSIAYNQPYGAVDGNVIRVLSRYMAIDTNMREEKNKKTIETINQSFIEKSEPQIYTQALMELGALVCRPKNPLCPSCPLNIRCKAFLEDNVDSLPLLTKLNEKVTKQYQTFIIHKDHNIILRKRDENLLNGMYEYPQIETDNLMGALSYFEQKNIMIEPISKPVRYKHVFTHQIWEMDVYQARLISGFDESWQELDLSEYQKKPMAVAHRKIKK